MQNDERNTGFALPSIPALQQYEAPPDRVVGHVVEHEGTRVLSVYSGKLYIQPVGKHKVKCKSKAKVKRRNRKPWVYVGNGTLRIEGN